MAEWWQSPAYLERRAAGEVVTPGLIDWGGIVNAFNAPYNERVGRLPAGPNPPPGKKGDVTLYYNAGNGGPVDAKQDRFGSAASRVADRPSIMETGQWPQPPMTPQQHLAFRDTMGLPLPLGGTGPAGTRLAAGVDGYDLAPVPGPKAPIAPNPYGGYVATPRFASTPKAPNYNGYGASMRFASANAYPAAHNLNWEPTPDDGQIMADEMGLPVKTPGGKVYQPKYPGSAVMPSGKVAPRFGGTVPRAPQVPQRSGGLLAALFGNGGLFSGGNSAPASSGIGTAPSQGKAMVVSPGTSTGSTLESMGFSPGALVPAATVRSLSERKYI